MLFRRRSANQAHVRSDHRVIADNPIKLNQGGRLTATVSKLRTKFGYQADEYRLMSPERARRHRDRNAVPQLPVPLPKTIVVEGVVRCESGCGRHEEDSLLLSIGGVSRR